MIFWSFPKFVKNKFVTTKVQFSSSKVPFNNHQLVWPNIIISHFYNIQFFLIQITNWPGCPTTAATTAAQACWTRTARVGAVTTVPASEETPSSTGRRTPTTTRWRPTAVPIPDPADFHQITSRLRRDQEGHRPTTDTSLICRTNWRPAPVPPQAGGNPNKQYPFFHIRTLFLGVLKDY